MQEIVLALPTHGVRLSSIQVMHFVTTEKRKQTVILESNFFGLGWIVGTHLEVPRSQALLCAQGTEKGTGIQIWCAAMAMCKARFFRSVLPPAPGRYLLLVVLLCASHICQHIQCSQ